MYFNFGKIRVSLVPKQPVIGRHRNETKHKVDWQRGLKLLNDITIAYIVALFALFALKKIKIAKTPNVETALKHQK